MSAADQSQRIDSNDNDAPADTGVTEGEPEEPYKVELRDECLANLTACIKIGDVTYSNPSQANLRNNDSLISPTAKFIPAYEQDCLRSQLSLTWGGKRALNSPKTMPSERINALNKMHHTLRVDISPLHILDFDIINPRKFPLPKEFGCQLNDPKGKNYFDPKDKVFLTFKASDITISGSTIPQMEKESCEATFKKLATDLIAQKKAGKPISFFVVIPWSEDDQGMLEALKSKVQCDMTKDPLMSWIKDSPTAHLLQIGNILPVYEQPPLSCEGWVAQQKRTYQDYLEQHVYTIYSATNEHQYFKGSHMEWKATMFEATFTALPGTAFKNNEYDNNLPKMYLVHVNWKNRKVARPRPDDVIKAQLPFKVPECVEYTGPNPLPPRNIGDHDYDDQLNEDGTYRDDIIKEGELYINPDLLEEKRLAREDAAERAALYEKQQLQTWTGVVQRSDKSTPAGTVPIIVFRRKDFRYRGGEGCERRVDADIPTHNVDFRNLDRLKAEFEKATPVPNILLEPSYSDRTYRDTIRNLNNYMLLHAKDAETSLPAHLARYFVSFDDYIQFPPMNFFEHMAPLDYEKFLDRLSPYQKDAFISCLQKILHGYQPIQGCVASAKSYISILIIILALANESKRHTALMVQETNKGVDELALGIKEECQRHGLLKIIIRSGSLPTESARFNAKKLGTKFHENFHDENQETMLFMASKHLYAKAQSAEAKRKQGDKRFVPETKNLALYEAMWGTLQRLRKLRDAQSIALWGLMDHMERNPQDTDKDMLPELNKLRKILMVKTLRSADVIVTTSAQALRSTFQEAVQHINILALDEGAKRSPATTYALIGAYKFDLLIDNGDIRQQGPFCRTANNPEFWNPFWRVLTYSTLHRAIDSSVPTMYLNEQFRMHTHALTQWISQKYYGGMMLDGTLGKPTPPEVPFMSKVFNDLFGINDNFGIVLVQDSRSQIEDAGTSVFNLTTQQIALRVFNHIIKEKASTKLEIKKDLSVTCISAYKAEATMIELEVETFKDPNLESLVAEVVQGIGRDVVIVIIPNAKTFTKFVSEKRRLLVELSRHKIALLVIMSQEALDYCSYGFKDENAFLKSEFGLLKSLLEFAKLEKVVAEVDASQFIECIQCGQPGHKKSECAVLKDKWLPPRCNFCQERGHFMSQCPDIPEDERPARPEKPTQTLMLTARSMARTRTESAADAANRSST